MKKILFIFIVSYIFVFEPYMLSLGASYGNVYLEANKDQVEIGEEVQISLNIENENTAAFLANIYYDDEKFEVISDGDNLNVQDDKVKVVWYDESGGESAKQGELDKLVFKAKESGIAKFVVDGEFFDENAELLQTDFENLQVQIGRSENNTDINTQNENKNNVQTNTANLQILRVDREGLVPDFNPNIYEYDITVESMVNNIEVFAVSDNKNSEVNVTGNTRIKRWLKYNKD